MPPMGPCATAMPKGRACHRKRLPSTSSRSPLPCSMPTTGNSSTVISSPRTSYSTSVLTSCSVTLAWVCSRGIRSRKASRSSRERPSIQRLFEALARAMLGTHGPLLLLLDDLQWCDRETLAWVHYLLRFDPQARLLIVGTLRAEELTNEHPLQSLLATLRREGQLTQISLERLTAAEAATLAAQLDGRELDAEVATRLYQDTEGNALFVVETVRLGLEALEERGRQVSSSAEPKEQGAVQQTRLPPTIQAVITARLEQLSAQARELVSVAAVIGRAFSFEVLTAASGWNDEAVVEALDELGERRIIREQGTDGYDFSHDKLREGAYSALSRARRRLLHRRVADAMKRFP